MAAIRLDKMTAQALRKADAEGWLSLVVVGERLRVVSYVNEGLSRLYDLLVDTFDDYQLSTAGPTLVSNGNDYSPTDSTLAIPATFYHLRAIEYAGQDGLQRPVEVPVVSTVNRFKALEQHERVAVMRGGTFQICPPSNALGYYNLFYNSQFTPLVNDADTFESVNNYEELAELWAAIQIRHDAEMDTATLERRYGKLETQIRATASKRKAQGPKKVRRVRRTLWDVIRRRQLPEEPF